MIHAILTTNGSWEARLIWPTTPWTGSPLSEKEQSGILFHRRALGDTRTITYYQLYREANKQANALKGLGIGKGDRVVCYLPLIHELPITMLACAKIGAIPTVVFSGFSSGGLNSRVNDAEAKVVVTSDGFYRRGKPLPLKPNVDVALKPSLSVKNVLVVRRTGQKIPLTEGRGVYYDEAVKDQSAMGGAA